MKLGDGIDKEDSKEEVVRPAIRYARYGVLGIQMVVFVILGIYGGHWLDKLIGWKFPVLTLVLMLFGLAGSIWFLFQETRRSGK